MKFGKELKASIVQAWRNKYVRYALIKSKLKELKKLYEEHNIPMHTNHHHLNPEQLPKLLNKHSALKLPDIDIGGATDTTIDKSRAEFERNMNGLHNNPHQYRLKAQDSMIEFTNTNYNNNNDTITETSDSNESPDNNVSKNSKYRFSKVAEIVEADLERKMPLFEAKIQDIKLKEKEIVLILETDIFTVSKFYAEQCQYFAEQHNALILRVEQMCECQLELDTQNVTQKHHDDDDDDISLYTRKKSLRQSILTIEDTVDTIMSMDESGLDEDIVPQKVTTKDIAEQKSNLRVLFRQMYNAFRMLEKYRKINEMAFKKITKKHDKNSGHFKNLQDITMKLIKTRCNFGNDYFTQFLEKRLEYLYTSYLKPLDQKPGEALERLRHPPSTKEIQTESCIIGLCGGWSIAMLLISIILVTVSTLSADFWSSASVYRSWYIFRASMVMSVYLWLWGCDLWVFQKYQFNHAFIFGADPTTLMRVPHVWNIAAIFSVTTMLFTIFFVLSFMFPTIFNIDPEIFAMMCLLCWIVYVTIPFPWIKYTKKFLMKSLCKQIISPFSTVEFIDFFMADQWTSLFTLVVDLLFSFCYLFSLDFLLSGHDHSDTCDNIKTKAWLSLFKLVPYWIRFWQCIRRARDKYRSGKSVKWHCANAGKYSCAIIVVFINAFHVYYDSETTKYLAVVCGAVATIYAYFWDIYKDWGLLRYKANKQHSILRKELTYSAYTYYVAMVINLLCRIAWAISLFPASFGIYNLEMMHFLKLPLNIAEVMRRCMWNLFRIENEHLNNCGEFRVIKDIPIAHNYVSVIRIRTPKKHSLDGHNDDAYDDQKIQPIELGQIEEEEEEVKVSVKSRLSDDDDVLLIPTQQRTNTISADDQKNNDCASAILRDVVISRPQSNDKSNDSDTDSSSSVQSRRRKKGRRKGYSSVKTHYFDMNDDRNKKRKRIRKKKKKKTKTKKKMRKIKKRKEGQQTLTIKRIKTDEMSTSSLSEERNEFDFGDIKYRKMENKKFIRIRGDRVDGTDSSIYSQDSEISSDDSFTNRTWPKRYEIKDTKRRENKGLSENKIRNYRYNKIRAKRRITEDTETTAKTDNENSTEVIFKPKITANLTQENINILEEQKQRENERKSRNTMDEETDVPYYERNTRITRAKRKRGNNDKSKSTQQSIALISNSTQSHKIAMMDINQEDDDDNISPKMNDK